MKITRQRLSEIIKEEITSIQGEDTPNESAYSNIMDHIVPIIREALGPNANLYKVLTGMAEMYARDEWYDDDAGHETVADRKWADNPNSSAVYEGGESDEIMTALEEIPEVAQELAQEVASEIEKLVEPIEGLEAGVLLQAVAALLSSE